MKKNLLIICLMNIVLFIVGCDGATDGVEKSTSADDVLCSIHQTENYLSNVWLSEAGVLYAKDGLIYLSSIDEGSELVFCYDSNCEHPEASETNGDPKCMAALYEHMCRIAYSDNAVYFFVGQGTKRHNIYKMDTNGTTRKLVAELPFYYGIDYFAIFRGDKVYYTAKIPNAAENTTNGYYTYRIVEVDLIDGSYRFITEETTGLMNEAHLVGDTFFVRKTENESGGRMFVTTINMNTGEENVIISIDEWATGNRYIRAIDEERFFYWSKSKYEIGIMNVNGTIEKVILKGAEGEGFGNAHPTSKGIFYQRTYEFDNEPIGAYFMDFSTNEVINITEEKEKYGLVGYVEQNDAFVGLNSEENHVLGWTMWSREKILGEAVN